MRTKGRGLLHNVTVALGNWGSPEAMPSVAVALVRGHAAWARGRVGTEAARQALWGREEVDENSQGC